MPKHFFARVLTLALACLALGLTVFSQVAPGPVDRKNDPLKTLQYRLIGPFRGGRSGAVVGVPSQPNVYYYGSTGGGVWKSTDGGNNWENISDGYFRLGSVGATLQGCHRLGVAARVKFVDFAGGIQGKRSRLTSRCTGIGCLLRVL